MTADAVFGIFVLPAVIFALVYFPAVTRLSMGLVSPYVKADVGKRLFAASIDALLISTSCVLYWNSKTVLFLVAAGAYLLLRDAVGGQSIGKFDQITLGTCIHAAGRKNLRFSIVLRHGSCDK